MSKLILEKMGVGAWKYSGQVTDMINVILGNLYIGRPTIITDRQYSDYKMNDFDINGIDVKVINSRNNHPNAVIAGSTQPHLDSNGKIDKIYVTLYIPREYFLPNRLNQIDPKFLNVRLRLVIYHELNHCIEFIDRDDKGKDFRNEFINYAAVTNIIRYMNEMEDPSKNRYVSIFDLNRIFLKKHYPQYTIQENITPFQLQTVLNLIYKWFDKSEINASIAGSYGEIEALNSFEPLKTITDSVIEDLTITDEYLELRSLVDKDNMTLRVPTRRYNIRTRSDEIINEDFTKDQLANFKQFFREPISRYSDEKFYRWFIKYILDIGNRLDVRLKRLVKLYNNTILHAIHDEETNYQKPLSEKLALAFEPHFIQLKNMIKEYPNYKYKDLFFI